MISPLPQILLSKKSLALVISKYRAENAKFIENFIKMVWMTWDLLSTLWLKFSKNLLLLEENPIVEDLDSSFLNGLREVL